MFIKITTPPVAGRDFSFSIEGAVGVTSIEVRVDNRRILRFIDDQSLCRAAAHMPPDSAGRTLAVAAIDADGHSQYREYKIAQADTMMSRMPPLGLGREAGNMRFVLVN